MYVFHELQVIEEAGEKVTVAEDAYSLVDKYMRKLDQELLKFKLELEADNRGITEILEKRSLEMDQQQVSYQGFAFIQTQTEFVGLTQADFLLWNKKFRDLE